MGKVTFPNNYRAYKDDEVFDFYAVSLRQAWYMAYEHFDDELVDKFVTLDEYGNETSVIMDKEEEYDSVQGRRIDR